MNFLRYFRLSSYLLIGTGFFALLITDYYGMVSALIFAAILAVGWRVDAGKMRLPFATWAWNLATLAFLLVCIADVLFLRKITTVGLVNFLVFLQVTKIFTPKQKRDYLTLYIISFFLLLITSIMTFSVLFILSCILFAVTATWALITLTLKQDIEDYVLRSDAPTGPLSDEDFNRPALNGILNRKFFVATFGITLLSFFFSLIIFLILPRVREGMFFRYGALSQSVSGFSEEVALDTFGTIREDHTPVMRVTLPGLPENQRLPRLYWRGLSYGSYDGIRWKNERQQPTRIPAPSRYGQTAWFTRSTKAEESLLQQRIDLLSLNYEVLFGASRLEGVEGRFLGLYYDDLGGNASVIYNPSTPSYTVYSDISQPSAVVLQRASGANLPEIIRETYLQLPELSPRVAQLAHKLAEGLTGDYDTALAVQRYLQENYQYSLSVRRTDGLPPLEDFLFVNPSGHCEYYATGMAILLRIVGIPTRVVNGFAQGRWNDFGHFFTVRQSDAHAWVEVYFPAAGWVTFDPTPAAAFGENFQQFVEQPGFLAGIYQYSEYLRSRWNRYVIDFNTNDQAEMVVGAFRASRSARRNISRSFSDLKARWQAIVASFSWQNIGRIFGFLLLTACALALLRRFAPRIRLHWWPRRWSRRATSPQRQVLRFYKKMLRLLAKKGMSKRLAATPREFAEFVAQRQAPYAADVRIVTDLYYAVRYGEYQLQPEEALAVENLLKQIKNGRRGEK